MKLWKLKMPMEVPASQNITMEQFSSKQHNGVRDIMTTERSGKHLLYQKENIGSGSTNIHFAVAQGESLPDNEELEKSDIILSYLKFESEHTNKTSALPIFELTEEKTITVGWVVSFSDICRNIEFKSVRLWSVAE